LAVIVGVFILCWLPFFVVNIIDPYCGHCLPPLPVKIFVWLGYVNSFLNPLIYAQNKTFKSAFKAVLCCYQCRGINPRDVDTSDEERTAVSRPAPRTVEASPKPQPKTNTTADHASNTSELYAVTNGAFTASENAQLTDKSCKEPADSNPTSDSQPNAIESTELQNTRPQSTDVNGNNTQEPNSAS
jgi:hypothetical protein